MNNAGAQIPEFDPHLCREALFIFAEFAALFGTCRIMGLIMGFLTCGLWSPFTAAHQNRKKSVGEPAKVPFMAEGPDGRGGA